ncbi:MAG: hypothetical protein JXB26_14080 [Candidatus Aminicenantes bacterium]|nr:hypothetical protein [Candidatus Aminicenantes bacterium]
MQGLKRLCLFSLSTAFLFPLFCGTQKKSLTEYLPRETASGEWKKEGKPLTYAGENLFEYINGGAEIYHEYGFKRIAVQEYTGPEGRAVSVEIFEMTDPSAAFGIYSFKVSPEDRELPIGNGGQIAGYYLNFWKGNVVVTLTGFDEDETTKQGLEMLARAVEKNIEREGEKPRLVFLLPEEGLNEKDVRYFKGFLGLYNSRAFFSRDEFGFSEGVRGDYEGNVSLFLFAYADENSALDRFLKLRKTFPAQNRYDRFEDFNERLFRVEETESGESIFVTHQKSTILLMAGKADEDRAREMFTAVSRRMEGGS